MKTSAWICGLMAAVAIGTIAAAPAGNVYLVLGSDTAVWNAPGGLAVADYRGHFSPALFTSPQSNAFKVMDPAFREQFADSYGHPLKLTWWMLVGSAYGQADNTDVPIPSLMPLYLMRKYHGESLRLLGDELTLHYHTFYWSDYDGDGVSYWNEARSFHECRADFDLALAMSLLEEEVYPASFRSGWHYMDNEWQNYLNQIVPYSMDDDARASKAWHTNEPVSNVMDWSRAPTNCIPYHPDPADYQMPGESPGWNVHSVKMASVTQALMDQAFAAAAAGTDQVVSLWGHLPESTFLAGLSRMDTMAHTAASNHPGVLFRYCTAVEAMQRWQGAVESAPPQLDVSEEVLDGALTLHVRTGGPIFQPQPFVAVKDIYAQYRIVPCEPAGSNAWTVSLSAPRSRIAKYGVAVTSLLGDVATQIVRCLPDDLYLDNLDPSYREVSGTWTSSTNAAWGVDARVASLASNSLAQVAWILPVANAGVYHAFVQAPALSNAAGRLQFNFFAGTSRVHSVYFPEPLPPKEWVYLGDALLDPANVNYLEMLVSAEGQSNRVAAADVIKLSPLAQPLPGFITGAQVEASGTTANVVWTTAAPAVSWLEYGPSTTYGRFSATNTVPSLRHVVTLAGLAPGSSCCVRIQSTAGGLSYALPVRFTTTNFALTVRLFDLAGVWSYSTNNFDGVNWMDPGYNDSGWPSGPGLLWVDTRAGGPNAAVQPKQTQMPSNAVTGFPFVTYYFRKHFQFAASPAGAGLAFSNYIDDGAVFYLNGVEIYRTNMTRAPAAIWNTNLAAAYNCGGDATCPALFTLSGSLLAPLVTGDNVLAVEVHNYSARSPDITFGCALQALLPGTEPPALRVLAAGNGSLWLYWNGEGFTLQQAAALVPGATLWTDAPGPVTQSPAVLVPSGATFYRLRR